MRAETKDTIGLTWNSPALQSCSATMANLIPKYDPDLFNQINQAGMFLPSEENEDSVRCILYVAGIITVVNLILLQMVRFWMGCGKSKDGSCAAWKVSYQLTNLLVNLTFGCFGIYYHSTIPWAGSTRDKITGYDHLKMFAVGQIGYQLWALPIGFFFVGETKAMLVHHVAVIYICLVSAFVRSGFRYYTPYFYGVIEISSVPLSVMNSFKNNKDWMRTYPDLYLRVRLTFCVIFLLVRVVLWTPFYWDFFANASMLLYSSEVMSTKIILTIFNLASLVLTMLQYFWASKIVSGLVKAVRPKTEKKEV